MMFSSSSKTPASRLKSSISRLSALASTLALLGATGTIGAFAQDAATPVIGTSTPGTPVIWPSTAGPRVGELAPQLTLPDHTNKIFDSRAFLGQKPLYLVLDGPTPLMDWNDDLAHVAQKADQRGIVLALAAPNPFVGKEFSWGSPFHTLRAPDGSLKEVAPPAFLAIDRAGWLRDVEKLPTAKTDAHSVTLQFLLSQPDPTPKLEVGSVAPDFSFRDADGNWRRVSALRGRKNLLLTFFPKCFTGKCRTHLSSLRDQLPGFLASSTEVWAVSVDVAEGDGGQLAFSRELILPFPLLPDTGRNICLLYGAAAKTTDLAQRRSVLIDKNGIVRWITSNVNPDTHGEDVLAKITELGLEK